MAYEEYYGRSGITDPKVVAMLRRRKMAEDLMKTGSDTSPAATPLVGLSRVLQGLVGGYTAGMADKGASDASAASDAERQAAMAQAQALIDGAGGGGGGTMPAMVEPTAQPAQTGDTYGRILAAESGGSMQPGIYGDGGAAAGPGQVHAAALADVNRANGTNYTHEQLAAQPEVGKQVGQAYYKQLLDMFGGDDRKATAAYNAGPGRVKAAEAQYGAEWEKGLPAATREQYLPKVFGAPSAAPQAGAPPQPDSMAYAKRLIGQAAQFAQSPDPRIRALAGPLEKNAQLVMTQAERQQTRAAQIPPTIQMGDPDGKGVGIYERTPNGVGRRIGAAPRQPGESGGPFAGTGMDQQAANILLQVGPAIANGTATPEQQNQYALAYQHIEQGKVSMIPDPTDPSGQRQVMARIPGAVPPQFPRPGGGQPALAPDQAGGQPQAAPGGPQVIPGTQTSTISAGDRTTLRKAETEAASIISSLDRFVDTRGKAGVGERGASALGFSTELNTSFNAAALMAKGEALFNLGVLNGPDLDIIRRTLADPSTFSGATASQKTVEKQVGIIKDLIQSRLDAARKNFGGQSAPSAEEKPPAPALPPQAAANLKEGQQTTFGNGQVWTLQGGNPVRVK